MVFNRTKICVDGGENHSKHDPSALHHSDNRRPRFVCGKRRADNAADQRDSR